MFRPQLNPVEPPWYVTRMPGGVGGAAPRGAPLSRSRTMRQYIKGWITQWDLRRLEGSEVRVGVGEHGQQLRRRCEPGGAARVEHRGALAGRGASSPPRAAQPAFGLTWRAPLPPYQQAGIARLLAEPGVLLADEMGLGKTIQAIGALRLLLRTARRSLPWSWCRPGWCCSGAGSSANGRRS